MHDSAVNLMPRGQRSGQRSGLRITLWLLAVLGFSQSSAALAGGSEAGDRTIGLISRWVSGQYDNSAQAERDLADASVPDDLKHRLMHQLFVPVAVSVPAIPGYLVFQQSSVDGSNDPDTIVRAGLLQFFVDEAGAVHQRELNFLDLDAGKNAYRSPDRLHRLTLDQFRFDPGCDFLLQLNPSGNEISGPMRRGACRFFSPGLNKTLTADDAVTIRPDQFWFLGRFVDDAGNVMWGNASPEPVKLVRRSGTADVPSPGPE